MTQRTERIAGEIREILAGILARQEIKDARVQDAGIITITQVRVSGDLRLAWAHFTVFGADGPARQRVREGLGSAGGYLRRRLGSELRLKVVPSLSFEIDTGFDAAEKVEALLRQLAPPASPEPEPEPPGDDEA